MKINFLKCGRFGFVSFLFGLVFVGNVPVAEAVAKQCDARKRAEILAPATKKNQKVRIDCSIKLTRRDLISKRVYIEGNKGTGVHLNCNGARIDGSKGKFVVGKLVLVIRSLRAKGKGAKEFWQRPQNVTVSNCRIIGSIQVYGMGVNGESEFVRKSSHSKGHTKRVQRAAPTRIVLQNLSINAQRRIPIYVSPGVTYLTFRNSVIKGSSPSVAMYLDAESAYNKIVNNRFNVATRKRELLAIDGSAYNVIKRNIFTNLKNGGIYLYRNCGEGGTVRHQAPQYNKIAKNGFFYRRFKGYKKTLRGFGKKKYFPAIWLGSRNGNRKYCNYDRGYNFGSSKNDGDFANNNTVTNNQIVKLSPTKMIKSFSARNTISGNRTVRKIQLAKRVKAPVPRLPPKQPAPRKPPAQNGQFDFSCKVKNNNNGCKKFVQCPAGLRVQAVKAACDLEGGSVRSTQLNQVRWNALRVVRRSDRVRHGVCSIGEVDIMQGGANLSFLRDFERFYIGCKEYDRNGGDCEIRGRVVCR